MKVVPYTYVNLGVVGVALLTRLPAAHGVAFANSVAVLLSFYAGLAIDPTARDRLLARWRYTYDDFVARDFMIHVLPVLLMAYVSTGRHPRKVPAGVVSLGLHLAWLASVAKPGNPFGDLSHVYVKMTPFQWKVIWGVAAVAHLCALPSLRIVKNWLKVPSRKRIMTR